MKIESDKYIQSEQKLLHILLRDKKSIEDLLESKMGAELFSDRHSFLAECIFKEYLDSKASFPRLLTRESYEKYLIKRIGKEGQVLSLLAVYDACLLKVSASVNHISYLKQDLLDGYAARKTRNALDFYDKERLSNNYSATQKLIDRLNAVTVVGGESKSFFVSVKDAKEEYFTEKEKQRNNPAAIIKCGIDEFDKAMVIGLAPQTLTMIVADTGGGKSTVMLSMGLNIAKSGHDILFVSLEMDRFRLMDRIISNLATIGIEKISQPSLMTDQEFADFKKAWDKWDDISGNFIIMEANEWVTVSSLKREIEVRTMSYKPKVVFVDYIGMLQPENKYKGRPDIELGEISKSLRFLGKKHGFATVSACQLNRDAIRRMKKSKENLAGSEDLRGSGELSNDSDFIFALFPTQESNRLKAQTIKSRYGKSHNTFSLKFDGGLCRVSNCSVVSISHDLDELDNDFSKKDEPTLDDLDADFNFG